MQLNALKRTVMGLGAQHGAGKTSMIALAEAVTEAAQDNVITPENVPEIYDKFREGVTAKSSYEDAGVVPDEAAMDRIGNVDQDKSREQQLSKLRQFVHLGNKYDSDALDLIRRARNMHIDLLRQAPDRRKSSAASSRVRPMPFLWTWLAPNSRNRRTPSKPVASPASSTLAWPKFSMTRN